MDWHWDSFHFLVIMSSVAMNVLKCIYLDEELLGYRVYIHSILVDNANFPKWYINLHSHYESSDCSISLPTPFSFSFGHSEESTVWQEFP